MVEASNKVVQADAQLAVNTATYINSTNLAAKGYETKQRADGDRLALLNQACPELKQNEAEDALAQISAAKSLGLLPQSASADFHSQAAISIADLCRRYEAALRTSNAVDFDDLILLPVRLLEEHPDVLAVVHSSSVEAGEVHLGSRDGQRLAFRPLPYPV